MPWHEPRPAVDRCAARTQPVYATTEHAVWDTPAHLLQANDARRRPIATSKAARVPAAARTWSAPLFSHVVLLPTRRIGRVCTRAALASAHTS